ncbi:MAG: PEP-CTERM sorting domain-containing protein [Cellvibrio sp.]
MHSLLNLISRFTFAAIASVGITSYAYATFIDFNDLVPVYDPEWPCFCDNPLTNQYESKGLLIENAHLNGESYDGGLTYENSLTSGPYTALHFIGQLPTFVSMYVSSINGDAISLTAYGPGGGVGDYQTPGFAGPFEYPPAEPNHYVSFQSDTGISQINIDAFYFRRVGAAIDNLTFTYSASVPEPSSLALLLSSFLAILWRRLKAN